jgi:hypothetical protein
MVIARPDDVDSPGSLLDAHRAGCQGEDSKRTVRAEVQRYGLGDVFGTHRSRSVTSFSGTGPVTRAGMVQELAWPVGSGRGHADAG